MHWAIGNSCPGLDCRIRTHSRCQFSQRGFARIDGIGLGARDRQHADASAGSLFAGNANPSSRDFNDQVLGRFDAPRVDLQPRSRKIAESEAWTAYDVVLDVHQGLFSWGVLVVPKNLPAGKRLPVIVCQHGRGAIPRDTLDAGSTAYNDFAAKLAERGYICFAPYNLYRGEDQYRWLDRKANAIGCTLFSFIVAQHQATLEWLESLPCVDDKRIAFYGLSYGGETAMRVPAVLEEYCLSICSGDFNQWTRKVAATERNIFVYEHDRMGNALLEPGQHV